MGVARLCVFLSVSGLLINAGYCVAHDSMGTAITLFILAVIVTSEFYNSERDRLKEVVEKEENTINLEKEVE